MSCRQVPLPSKPHAIRSARMISGQRTGGRLAIAAPNRVRWASATWSKLSAHATGMPSSGVRMTSVEIPRTVLVAGTTMTSFSSRATESRASSRTGRRLSGGAKVYQRISPLRIHVLPTLGLPSERVTGARELVRRGRRGAVRLGIRAGSAGRRHQCQLGKSHLLIVRKLLHERPQILGG